MSDADLGTLQEQLRALEATLVAQRVVIAQGEAALRESQALVRQLELEIRDLMGLDEAPVLQQHVPWLAPVPAEPEATHLRPASRVGRLSRSACLVCGVAPCEQGCFRGN
jgi:hypothetical protein